MANIGQLLVLGGELHCPRCANEYGVSPCTASIPTTGEYKCFKTAASCQDPINYVKDDEPLVIKFIKSSGYHYPGDDVIIPNLVSSEQSPAQLRPLKDIGERGTLTATFSNHSDNDSILDPYFAERDYNPYLTGDFWSKFDERYPNIQGYQYYEVRGNTTQTWDEMERFSYIVDRGILSGDMRSYSITARDVFMLLQNNKAQIPRPCDGFLSAGIGTGLTPFTLEPTGIGSLTFPDGKLMYPASGFATIGDEFFSYTRSGDTITPTARGLNGTVAATHDAGDSMQVAEVFDSQTSAEILERMLGFSEIKTNWYDVAVWNTEVENFDSRLYTGIITEPMNVDKAMNELIQDVGLSIYPDISTEKIVMEYVRKRQPDYFYSDGNIFDISRNKDYDKRISAVYMRFGRRNPMLKMDEDFNYLGRIYRFNDNLNQVLQENTNVVHSQYSRFIPIELRAAADQTAKIHLARYGAPPRVLSFSVDEKDTPRLGKICSITSRFLRDPRGKISPEVMFQITRVKKMQGKSLVVAEEFNFIENEELSDHVITIAVDTYGFNLRKVHDELFSSLPENTTIKVYIDPGVKIGQGSLGSMEWVPESSAYSSSFYVSSDWPDGTIIEIYAGSNTSRMQGAGGGGGVGPRWGETIPILEPGYGRTAFFVRWPVTIYGDLQIWGGGGGGPGGNYLGSPTQGGGGQGYPPGNGGGATSEHPGGGFTATPRGGDAGMAAGGRPPEEGGTAIDGVSYVTFNDTPWIRGRQIN